MSPVIYHKSQGLILPHLPLCVNNKGLFTLIEWSVICAAEDWNISSVVKQNTQTLHQESQNPITPGNVLTCFLLCASLYVCACVCALRGFGVTEPNAGLPCPQCLWVFLLSSVGTVWYHLTPASAKHWKTSRPSSWCTLGLKRVNHECIRGQQGGKVLTDGQLSKENISMQLPTHAPSINKYLWIRVINHPRDVE